jgi:hypothetical protein
MVQFFYKPTKLSMRKIAMLLTAFVFTGAVVAQDGTRAIAAVAGTTVKNQGGKTKGFWTTGGSISLNVNQGGFDNWISAGDADWSIGGNGYFNLFANKAWNGKKSGKVKAWTNNLDVNQAVLNVHDERTDINQFNKLDDRIDLLSRYSVQLRNTISFATVANVRTQLYDTKKNGERISGFFAPAVVTLAPGFEWKPTSYFNAFISPYSNRWVIVSNGPYSIAQGLDDAKPYGVAPQRMVDWQPGAFAQFNFNKTLDKAEKIAYKSRLDLYSNYARKAQNVDVFWDNALSFKVNKWISASVNMTMIYDDDVRQFSWTRDKAGLQYNHNIGIGLARRF